MRFMFDYFFQVMMPKLVPFVRHGQKAHAAYLRRLHADHKIATCDVPKVSDVKALPFEESPGCIPALSCSVPEY